MWQEAISLPEGTTFLQPLSSDQNWCWPHSKEVHRQNRLNPKSTTDFNRFPFNNFTYCLTLFPKCFSSFPHGTCSLSVSRPYLALDGIYHPIWAAFPNNSTLRKRITMHIRHLIKYGILTLYDIVFQQIFIRASADNTSLDYNSDSKRARLQSWAFPTSLAVTRGILVSFFSSAYWYA